MANLNSELLAGVDEAFRTLPARYLGAEPGFDATYRIKLRDIGRTWELRCTTANVLVRKGDTNRRPDVNIATDARTWMALRAGALSAIDALRGGRIAVRGNLDWAVTLEGLFRLPNGRPPLVQIHDIHVGRNRISTLVTGQGPDVLLLHGLGATRASMLYTASALSARYRVHVPDLPGFGSSGKPATGAYNARWFAENMLGLMDELGIARAHFVGNSMGGRISIEVALLAPHRVGGLGLLCPGVAFVHRELHPIVRLLRPELGMVPHALRRQMVASGFWNVFYDRTTLDPDVGELIVDEFQRIYHSAGARLAFLASGRNIYLEPPFGRHGFYPRLSRLEVPALFIWADSDRLIPAGFSRHVAEWLPGAEQVVLEHCGHVPQIERPEVVEPMLRDFLDRIDLMAAAPPLRRARAA
jgi:pimeloyl-ACP methyl ester carboxylesterase